MRAGFKHVHLEMVTFKLACWNMSLPSLLSEFPTRGKNNNNCPWVLMGRINCWYQQHNIDKADGNSKSISTHPATYAKSYLAWIVRTCPSQQHLQHLRTKTSFASLGRHTLFQTGDLVLVSSHPSCPWTWNREESVTGKGPLMES